MDTTTYLENNEILLFNNIELLELETQKEYLLSIKEKYSQIGAIGMAKDIDRKINSCIIQQYTKTKPLSIEQLNAIYYVLILQRVEIENKDIDSFYGAYEITKELSIKKPKHSMRIFFHKKEDILSEYSIDIFNELCAPLMPIKIIDALNKFNNDISQTGIIADYKILCADKVKEDPVLLANIDNEKYFIGAWAEKVNTLPEMVENYKRFISSIDSKKKKWWDCWICK